MRVVANVEEEDLLISHYPLDSDVSVVDNVIGPGEAAVFSRQTRQAGIFYKKKTVQLNIDFMSRLDFEMFQKDTGAADV